MVSNLRPRKIQSERFTIREIEKEILLYDEQTHRAWCLNPSSACIWRLCDGHNTLLQIAAAASLSLGEPVTEDLVLVTLAELREKDLLEPDGDELLPQGVTRRQMIARIGLTAAALLPVVAAIVAPPAASAQTGGSGTGGNGGG